MAMPTHCVDPHLVALRMVNHVIRDHCIKLACRAVWQLKKRVVSPAPVFCSPNYH